MWIDDLPMWGYLGDIEGDELFLTRSFRKSQVFLYTHTHFSIGFNGDQIVSVNVTTDPTKKVDITDTSAEMEVIFSYSVQWVHEPNLLFADRLSRYVDSSFLPSTFELHWLSIINSFVLVLL